MHISGGATACVIAGRLAARDPSIKILILEAGPHTLNEVAHVQPYLYPSHLSPRSRSTAVTFNVGNPSPRLNGRTPVIHSGHCVGGGSSVNRSYPSYNNEQNPGLKSRQLWHILARLPQTSMTGESMAGNLRT